MSTTIDSAFISLWNDEVFEAFQRRGSKLLPTTRRGDLKGNVVYWQKVGKGTAATKARHGLVPVMNQTHSTVNATMEDYYAGDWVDRLDLLKTNIEERQLVTNGGAWALGRKADDLIITSLSKGSADIAHGSVGMTADKALEVVQRLSDADVPMDGQIYAILPPKGFRDLTKGIGGGDSTEKGLWSSLFRGGNDQGAPAMSDMFSWLGVNWIMHTGTPKSGSTWTCYAWHRTAVGLNWGEQVTADITWHGDRASHFVNNWISMCAKRIEDTGVVQFEMQ